MQCVLLAAGQGKRLFPLTVNQPKVMVPIGNKPLLEHVLKQGIQAGISEYVIIVSTFKEQIKEYFEDGSQWNCSITYVDQGKPLGTGHAIQQIESFVSDHFLVLSGDTITSAKNIGALIKQKENTIGITTVSDASEYGSVSFENNHLTSIKEKTHQPASTHINTGLYHFDTSIFHALQNISTSKRQELEITDAFDWLISHETPPQILPIDTWVDIGKPWDLLDANAYILSLMKDQVCHGHIEKNVTLEGPVFIDAETRIRSGTYIQGPVVIGKQCNIGPNCYIRPATSIHDFCHVGNASEVKNSVIFKQTNVPHQNYVGDSVIGSRCNLGSGTKIANLRLDKKEIYVTHLGKRINTHRRKLGAIIGDDVQTGINAMINTGCIIGEEVFIAPGALAKGYIAPQSIIK